MSEPLADFQAFPFTQIQFMSALRDPAVHLVVDPGIMLDAALVTIAPPVPQAEAPEMILRSHRRIRGLLLECSAVRWSFGLQRPPMPTNGELVSTEELRTMVEEGIKVCAIAYQEENLLGGGFLAGGVRLKDAGKAFIDRMAEVGMALDLSHVGHATARDAIEYVQQRGYSLSIVATHGGCYEVYEAEGRNLPRDVHSAIAEGGGMIGLITLPFVLSAEGSSLDIVRPHLDYLLELVGPDKICFGTDAIYQCLTEQEAQQLFDMVNGAVNSSGNFRTRPPMQPEELNTPELMAVMRAWLRQHYEPAVANAICGGNLAHYLETL